MARFVAPGSGSADLTVALCADPVRACLSRAGLSSSQNPQFARSQDSVFCLLSSVFCLEFPYERLREARRLLPGPAVRPGEARTGRRLAAVRLSRSRHARRVRGHDGERQDRVVPVAARRSGDRRGPGDCHRSEGRPRQPHAHLPRASARGLRAVGQSGGRAAEGRERRRLRAAAGRVVEERPGRVGPGRRPDCAPPRVGRRRHLHAGERSRAAGVDLEIARRAGGRCGRRGRGVPRARDDNRDEPPRPARHRGGPGEEPRSHSPLDAARHVVARRQGRRSADAHPADPVAADDARRRVRPRVVLPVEGALRPGDGRQQPAGLARLQLVDDRRPARHPADALHRGGQAADRDLLDLPSWRRGADVLRVAAAQPGGRLDAGAGRDDEPAGTRLHGRDRRVLPAGGQPAIEGAAADAPEAGARVRTWRGAGDAESRGPRLQGALQRGHVVPRPAADRA